MAYLQLYKHALESIFSHLNLLEIARVTATCRDWSAAVDSMRPIGALAGRSGRLDLHSMRNSRLMRHILEIHLGSASISVSEISSLCDIIKQSTSLTTVNLRYNKIGDVVASAVAEAIKQSNSRTTVNLSDNWIGGYGASAIAEAIKQSKSLSVIDLSHNLIGAYGASSIAEAIKQSTSLTTVNLRYNKIGSIGASAITDAIKQSKPMTVDF